MLSKKDKFSDGDFDLVFGINRHKARCYKKLGALLPASLDCEKTCVISPPPKNIVRSTNHILFDTVFLLSFQSFKFFRIFQFRKMKNGWSRDPTLQKCLLGPIFYAYQGVIFQELVRVNHITIIEKFTFQSWCNDFFHKTQSGNREGAWITIKNNKKYTRWQRWNKISDIEKRVASYITFLASIQLMHITFSKVKPSNDEVSTSCRKQM